MSLTQTAAKQLSVSWEFLATGATVDAAFVAILTLQQPAWVNRVRGVLDGPGKAAGGTDRACRTIYDDHERMHNQAKLVVALSQSIVEGLRGLVTEGLGPKS
jgi:hypothetical protein